MDFLVTLLVPDFGQGPALYSGTEPPVCGTRCVLDQEGTLDIGTVCASRPLEKGDRRPITRLLRTATAEDDRAAKACEKASVEALSAFTALAAKYNLQTRAVQAHVFLGRNRLVLWHRPQASLPDLRSFEGEFRRKVRCIVDLREVGPRETAALFGGCGCCGRPLCCTRGRMPPRELPPQEMPLRASAPSPMAVNGLCNCPKCCLGF